MACAPSSSAGRCVAGTLPRVRTCLEALTGVWFDDGRPRGPWRDCETLENLCITGAYA